MGHYKFIVFKRKIIHHLTAVCGIKYPARLIVNFNIKIILLVNFRQSLYYQRGVLKIKLAHNAELLFKRTFFLDTEKLYQKRDV